MDDVQYQIAALLRTPADHHAALKKILGLVLARFQSETGTLHRLDREKQLLHLVVESGLPPALLDVVKTIPVGKGIAGETAARGAPVTICNIQTDTSGVAKPGARQTGVGGALCVPVRDGDAIVGTLGVGTIREYQYTPEETRLLEDLGRLIGAQFGSLNR
jgi:L-methionine (R)-S-oxide reductase